MLTAGNQRRPSPSMDSRGVAPFAVTWALFGLVPPEDASPPLPSPPDLEPKRGLRRAAAGSRICVSASPRAKFAARHCWRIGWNLCSCGSTMGIW